MSDALRLNSWEPSKVFLLGGGEGSQSPIDLNGLNGPFPACFLINTVNKCYTLKLGMTRFKQS